MKKKTYLAPEVKTVECKMTSIICGSVNTEGFKWSGNTYGDSAWD